MERSLRRRRVAPVAIPEAHNADRKRGRKAPPVTSAGEIAGDGIADDFFDRIPDDLLIIVLSKLSSTASCPSDFINALSSVSGISLMAKAAIGFHAPALYSLAVIQFNGSGSSKKTKDLYAGVAFCARAASLGHLDALREFGHCLQDGYGVRQNVLEGRRCLIHANYSEITGTAKTAAEPHPVNRFMAEWFAERLGALGEEDLRLCSNKGCGRRETRRHEFRRCSMCGAVNYCSRVCQAMDWKISHKMECTTWFFREQPLVDVPGGGADGDTGGPMEQAAAAGGVMEQGAV